MTETDNKIKYENIRAERKKQLPNNKDKLLILIIPCG